MSRGPRHPRRPILDVQTITISILIACTTIGCKQEVMGPLPLCLVELVGAPESDVLMETPSTKAWFELLLRDHERLRRTSAVATKSCGNLAIEWTPIQDCLEPGSDEPTDQPTPLALDQLGDEHLVLSTTETGMYLAWVVTATFPNGDGLGPVGLVEHTPQRFAVHALGTLRANPKSASLELVSTVETEDPRTMLVVESERCAPGPEGPSEDCHPEMQLFPLEGHRFVHTAILNSEGTCLSPARIPIAREVTVEIDAHLARRYKGVTALDVADGKFLLQEQLTVVEVDPSKSAATEYPFHNDSDERHLQIVDGKLIASDTSLWSRMLAKRDNDAPESKDP